MSITAINESFIYKVTQTRKPSSASTSATSSSSSAVITSINLRLGVSILSKSVSTLSSLTTFLHVSTAALTELEKIVDSALLLSDKAADSSSSKSERRKLNTKFGKLGREFNSIVNNLDKEDNDPISLDSVTSLFKLAGLDPDEVSSIERIFSQFIVPQEDDKLASDEMTASAIRLPAAILGQSTDASQDTFDLELNSRSVATVVNENLKALKEQITQNLETIDLGVKTIAYNIQAIQVIGTAMLNISNQITTVDEAENVVEDLKDAISKFGLSRKALNQLDNLESIFDAAALLNTDSDS